MPIDAPVKSDENVKPAINIPKVMKIGELPDYQEVNFAEVDFSRDENAHLIIKIKGKNYWSQFYREDMSTVRIAGVLCHRPKFEQLEEARAYFVMDNSFQYNDAPNLMLLLAKDIEQGVTFDFGIVPISESRCYVWAEQLHYAMKALYTAYVKPVNIRATFTTQLVEKETIN